jgi:DNA polymerase
MRLPSKRKISYFKPVMGTNRFGKECVTYLTRDSQSRKYVRRDGYGGMFTENAVQGAARDVMAGTFDPLIEAGFTPVFSVHDEVITEASPDRDLQEVIDIVERVPDWAPGLPVAADGYDAMRYRK